MPPGGRRLTTWWLVSRQRGSSGAKRTGPRCRNAHRTHRSLLSVALAYARPRIGRRLIFCARLAGSAGAFVTLASATTGVRTEGVEPSWPKPPVSETGAYPCSATSAWVGAAGVVPAGGSLEASSLLTRPVEDATARAVPVEARLATRLELDHLGRARRLEVRRRNPNDVQVHSSLLSLGDGLSRGAPSEGAGRTVCETDVAPRMDSSAADEPSRPGVGLKDSRCCQLPHGAGRIERAAAGVDTPGVRGVGCPARGVRGSYHHGALRNRAPGLRQELNPHLGRTKGACLPLTLRRRGGRWRRRDRTRDLPGASGLLCRV